MADIFARIAEKSGLDFQFEACPAATALRAVKLGRRMPFPLWMEIICGMSATI